MSEIPSVINLSERSKVSQPEIFILAFLPVGCSAARLDASRQARSIRRVTLPRGRAVHSFSRPQFHVLCCSYRSHFRIAPGATWGSFV